MIRLNNTEKLFLENKSRISKNARQFLAHRKLPLGSRRNFLERDSVFQIERSGTKAAFRYFFIICVKELNNIVFGNIAQALGKSAKKP